MQALPEITVHFGFDTQLKLAKTCFLAEDAPLHHDCIGV